MAESSTVSRPVFHRPRGIVRLKSIFTASAGGAVTAFSLPPAFGKLVGILLDTGSLGAAVDITIADAGTGAVIWTGTNLAAADAQFRPTIVPTAQTQAAVTPGAGLIGTQDIYVAGAVTVTVAGATADSSGGLTLIVDEGVPTAAQ